MLSEKFGHRPSLTVACEDLAGQLVEYVSRKMSMPGLALDDVLGRVEKGVKAKVSDCVWDFSPAEITWVIKRTRELRSEATGGGGVHHDR